MEWSVKEVLYGKIYGPQVHSGSDYFSTLSGCLGTVRQTISGDMTQLSPERKDLMTWKNIRPHKTQWEKSTFSLHPGVRELKLCITLGMSSYYLHELMPQTCPLMQVLSLGLCLVNPPEGHKVEEAAEKTPGRTDPASPQCMWCPLAHRSTYSLGYNTACREGMEVVTQKIKD